MIRGTTAYRDVPQRATRAAELDIYPMFTIGKPVVIVPP